MTLVPKKKKYVEASDLKKALIEYKIQVDKATAEGKPIPNVPRYIWEIFEKICKKTASRPNFSRYTYIDDMIAEAMLHCLSAIPKFNPHEEKDNSFGYFSRVVWNAFLIKIADEKKETYIKHKNFERLYLEQSHEDTDFSQMQNNEFSNIIIKDFEDKMKEKKEKAQLNNKLIKENKKGLEQFEEENNG